MGIIIRNDDVNPNTNLAELDAMYNIILDAVPNAEIWTVFSPLCKRMSHFRGLYSPLDYPIKNHTTEFFYKELSKVGLPLEGGRYFKICSHGLIHVSHKNMPYAAQEMSIVASCSILNCQTFVPPFSDYDETTERVCSAHNIELIKNDDWKAFDFNEFNPDHKKWYFHSWRYTVETLKEKFAHVVAKT